MKNEIHAEPSEVDKVHAERSEASPVAPRSGSVGAHFAVPPKVLRVAQDRLTHFAMPPKVLRFAQDRLAQDRVAE